MTSFNSLKEELQAYYNSEGIVPGDGFACKNMGQCGGNFERGMQCHIGSKYGEKIRILVASLDCGYGGKGTIEERTGNVVSDESDEHLDTPPSRSRGTVQGPVGLERTLCQRRPPFRDHRADGRPD